MSEHAIVDDFGDTVQVINCDDEDGGYTLAPAIAHIIDLWLELHDEELDRTSFTVYKDGRFAMYGRAFMGRGELGEEYRDE